LKSTQVLTATERETLVPLDQKISAEIPKQKTPLKETYTAVLREKQSADAVGVDGADVRRCALGECSLRKA
jgi:hypothetical protein